MSVRRTSEVPIPDDLRAFLAARKQLAYEPPLLCEVGAVKLKPLRALRLQKIWVVAPAGTERHDPNRKREGFYVVPVVDLCGRCSNYDPVGILVWIPALEAYGTWDYDHGRLVAFPRVSWQQINRRPVYYLEAQWGSPFFPTAKGEAVKPWKHDFAFRTGEPGRDILGPSL